jgi:inorganic pyrophosphatase
MRVEVIVEVPKGSRNKYEMDHEGGAIWLDRELFTATRYPGDYGFVPHTLAEDGDPLDCLVVLNEPTFPGCHLWVRPVGVLAMADENGLDAKVLAVLDDDPRTTWQDLADVPDFLMLEVRHFFDIYKQIEPGKRTEILGWLDRAAAEREVEESRARYLAARA